MTEQAKEKFDSWLESEPWKEWKRIGLTGLAGSSKAYITSFLRGEIKGPLLVVVPHLQNAEIPPRGSQIFSKGDQ